jgi:hypothetical protein
MSAADTGVKKHRWNSKDLRANTYFKTAVTLNSQLKFEPRILRIRISHCTIMKKCWIHYNRRITILMLSPLCVIISVLPCTNYDNTNLRNYLSFEITFLDAFRLLLCKPSSGALDFPHFLGFFHRPFQHYISVGYQWLKDVQLSISQSLFCTKHFCI